MTQNPSVEPEEKREGSEGKRVWGRCHPLCGPGPWASRILTLAILNTQLGLPGALHWSLQYPPALHVSKLKWGLLPALKRDHLEPSAGHL